MPIQHTIWRVGTQPTLLATSKLVSEQQLEEMIVREPRILSSEWMLIGRQEITSHGGRIDLLAIAPDGALVLIELKRDRTPREIVAQALDYASWVAGLTADRIVQIYSRFSQDGSLEADFQQRFGTVLDEETLNHAHQIIIVAAELDPASERIVGYPQLHTPGCSGPQQTVSPVRASAHAAPGARCVGGWWRRPDRPRRRPAAGSAAGRRGAGRGGCGAASRRPAGCRSAGR